MGSVQIIGAGSSGGGGGGVATLVMPAEFIVTPVGTVINVTWTDGRLLDVFSGPSLDFWNHILFDETGVPSIDYTVSRQLKDAVNDASINWGNRNLITSGNVLTVDWANALLTVGSTIKINWGSSLLVSGVTGNVSVDWDNRILGDGSGIDCVQWNNRTAIDNGGFLSIDWNGRNLIDANGNAALSWEGYQLLDFAGIISVDWGNRTIKDTGGLTVLNFSVADPTTIPDSTGPLDVVATVNAILAKLATYGMN